MLGLRSYRTPISVDLSGKLCSSYLIICYLDRQGLLIPYRPVDIVGNFIASFSLCKYLLGKSAESIENNILQVDVVIAIDCSGASIVIDIHKDLLIPRAQLWIFLDTKNVVF